ncbi:MAG TPA: aromatic amino acid aminotransferase, partial [Zymomonas mobilis]|nr:aromatic amino acid aminotransferase [Zymomonas mobilis]
MFSILPLSPEQIKKLRIENAIYMAPSGRINVAGLTPTTIDPFVKAIQKVI